MQIAGQLVAAALEPKIIEFLAIRRAPVWADWSQFRTACRACGLLLLPVARHLPPDVDERPHDFI